MGDAQRPVQGLEALVERIRDLEELDGGWALGAEEVRQLLGILPEEFLRTIYAADRGGNPLVDLGAATSRFCHENIWEFVALVELFCGSQAAERLQAAGIFFTHPEQLEILGTFVSTASGAVQEHALDSGEFSAMLAAFGSFERARACYLDEHFHLDELIEAAVARYCDGRHFGIPTLARRNVRRLLRYFFQKHVVEPRDLFARVSGALFAQAVREGYEEPPRVEDDGEGGRRRAGTEGDRSRELSELVRARRVMELGEGPLSRGALKRQYKRLIKRYHPDLNPAGLARCQEVTAAYSLILSSL